MLPAEAPAAAAAASQAKAAALVAPPASATDAPAAAAPAAAAGVPPLSGPGRDSFDDIPAEEAEPESLGAGSVRLHLSWRPLQRPASALAAAQGGQEEAAAEGGTPAGEPPLQPAPTFIRLLSRRVDLAAEPAAGGDDAAAAAAEAAEEGRAAQRRRKEQSADAVEAGLPLELLLDPLPLHLHAYGHGGEWNAPGNLPHQLLVMFCVLHLPLILDAYVP